MKKLSLLVCCVLTCLSALSQDQNVPVDSISTPLSERAYLVNGENVYNSGDSISIEVLTMGDPHFCVMSNSGQLTQCKIERFDVIVDGQMIPVIGNRFSEELNRLFKRLQSGDIIRFVSFEVMTPQGKRYRIPPQAYCIK